jgi:2-iminoacetate synthase
MKFSQTLSGQIEQVQRIGNQPLIGPRETENLLVKATEPSGLTGDEIVTLLNGLEDSQNAQVVLDFSRGLSRPRDSEIFLLPPLYFSSVCENSCLYCDFSTTDGVRLTVDEFSREVEALIGMGYRSIELVSGQDPELYVREQPFDPTDQKFELSGVLRYFEVLKAYLANNGGGMITSNIPPVCTQGFGKLKEAGLDCFLAWLETFDPDRYALLHLGSGPKGNQAFRLDSFERALEVGVEHVAGGFLKGLADWRSEEAVLYLFDRHLRERWGRGFSIIGSPRVKGRFLGSMVIQDSNVSDDEYELNVALDRVLFDGILWLQTRESFDFNRHLIKTYGGGVVLTLTSCTAPGGYSKPAEGHAQFPVHSQDYLRSVSQLEEDGITVRYTWNADDLGACRRIR